MFEGDNRHRPLLKACDFCSHPSFIKAYACHSFVYLKGASSEYHSAQEWAACSHCASLIDAGEWHALAERAMRSLTERYRLSRSEITFFRKQVDRLHGAFRQHIIAES